MRGEPLSIYGAHRVLSPAGELPQGALKLDNTPRLLDPSELLLDVDFLALDATSMRQIRESCGGGRGGAARRIEAIVAERGKLHNPATNSGGVLAGRVRAVGPRFFAGRSRAGLRAGQAVIPVASLSTLPLRLERVRAVAGERVLVSGTAVVFSCMKVCPIPEDLGPELALACVDISSLVPQLRRFLPKTGRRPFRALVMGCGKAGAAALFALREARPAAPLRVLAVDSDASRIERIRALGLAEVLRADARDAEKLYGFVRGRTAGELCDLVVNVVSVPGTETAAVLCARPRGAVLWFSMATRFDRAALATDALGKDVTMIIGNGVAENQAQETFALVRCHPALRAWLAR
ncbi:MAG: L-erythro-3,5-diaminohexanoate dehydrogenase [Elusimicrobia bacterium]|nr:L-erythro-3,5-diaminohexanoate dehydrogenase [Elusimicrobiota bacterium]